MYRRIAYLGKSYSLSNTHIFALTDTDFETVFLIHPQHRGICISGMIHEYEKRKLPVTANIARHYVYMYSKYKWTRDKLFSEIMDDTLSVVEHYPEYKKYFKCLLNQIKRVAYVTNAPTIV